MIQLAGVHLIIEKRWVGLDCEIRISGITVNGYRRHASDVT